MADSSTNSTSQTQVQTPGQKHKDLTPEQRKERKAAYERMGLTRKDLKDLSPDDRKAKIKEAADKTVAELEQKKAAGSLTEQEQADLNYIKNSVLGHKRHKAAAAN